MRIPSPLPFLNILALCLVTLVLQVGGLIIAIIVMLGFMVVTLIAGAVKAMRRLWT